MRLWHWTALLATAVPALAYAQQPNRLEQIDAVFKPWSTAVTPGCSVSVAPRGQPIIERAYGSADLEHDTPNTPSTIFDIASGSKQFTAAATLLLAQDGKLSLKDDIRTYLPELPNYGDVITVDHLLTHTSGLRDWGDLVSLKGWPRQTAYYTNQDVLDMAVRQRSLNPKPGAEYTYNSTGFNLLAIIVERVSGKSLPEFTRERFFEPLGMKHTGWKENARRIVANRAIGYEKDESGYSHVRPLEDAYGNGGILTNSGDIILWLKALDEGRLGSFVTAKMQEPAKLNDGRTITHARGLFVDTYNGFRQIAHDGGAAGYTAWLGRFPDQGVSLAVLCNAYDARAPSLARKVASLYLPAAPAADANSALTAGLAAPDLRGRGGVYVNQRTGLALVLVEDGTNLKTRGDYMLRPRPGGRLALGRDDILFNGPESFQLYIPEGEVIIYRREPAFAPSKAELPEFAGDYRSDEALVTHRVVVEDDHLQLRIVGRSRFNLRLVPIYRDAFEMNGDLVKFHRDRAGRISSLSWGTERIRDISFARLPSPSAAKRWR